MTEPTTAACNCDASGDPPTGHRPWCGTEPDDEPCCITTGWYEHQETCPQRIV